MDDEARRRLIAEATVQNAREEAKRARVNMPIGLALVAFGVTLSTLAAVVPLGLIGTVVLAGIGFVFIPGGLAVIVRAASTIARANRALREHQLPAARTLKS
ncbi:MAG TPA: hypothetical protein VFV99_27885 [Kofleriaceae bacterium]|nr:hypothetical protein [Kofleriaceae bacterium]